MKYVKLDGTVAAGSKGNGTITADALNIRKSNSNTSEVVGSYKKNDVVEILEVKEGWGRTDKGWISMVYVDMDEASITSIYKTGKGTITADSLYIRKEAKDDGKIVGTYKKGDKVEVTEIKGKWGKTSKGWISMKYVKMDATQNDKDDDQKYDDDEIGKNKTFKKGTATVKVNTTLTIRKTAAKNGEVVGSYNDGDTVKILKVDGEWGQTDKGWINLRYVVYK